MLSLSLGGFRPALLTYILPLCALGYDIVSVCKERSAENSEARGARRRNPGYTTYM